MRWLLALFLAFATAARAADHSGSIAPSPLDRPVPGLRDPLDVRDPLLRPPSDSAALPDLGSSPTPDPFRELHPRALPGAASPLVVEPRDDARPQVAGPPPYWEHDPLYHAPVP
jgi:hypothetical protein